MAITKDAPIRNLAAAYSIKRRPKAQKSTIIVDDEEPTPAYDSVVSAIRAKEMAKKAPQIEPTEDEEFLAAGDDDFSDIEPLEEEPEEAPQGTVAAIRAKMKTKPSILR